MYEESVALDVLWRAHDCKTSDNSKCLYVNYIPRLDAKIRDLFYRPSEPDLPLPETESNAVSSLFSEIEGLIPPIQPIRVGNVELKASSRFGLVHQATPTWVDQAKDVDSIHWYREITVGDKTYGTQENDIALSNLTSFAKSTIRILDGLAMRTSYERYLKTLKRLSDSNQIGLPPLKKVRVFISYRRPQLKTAKTLHSIMDGYGNNSYLDPFMDEHNLGLGNLVESILRKISACQIFVPLVTDDYGEKESVSRLELDEALILYKSRKIEIAPIFLGKTNSEVANNLKQFKYHRVKDAISEDAELLQFIKTIVQTGLVMISAIR